jgi:hypothetical protein
VARERHDWLRNQRLMLPRFIQLHRQVCMADKQADPVAVTNGKVSAWLSFPHATVTGSGYSSVPDLLGGSPAVQATDARRPVNATSANGLAIATFTDDVLAWPLSAVNNNATRMGFAFWLTLFAVNNAGGGASANKFNYLVSGSATRIDEAVVDRHAQSGVLDTNWHFITLEIDCSQASEALDVLQTIDTVAQTVSFSSGTPWPASMATPTGNMWVGGGSSVAISPLVGSIGPNIWTLNAQLTLAERTALSRIQAPT